MCSVKPTVTHQERGAPAESFGDSPKNWLRITTVRVIVQTVTLAMFVSFVLLTTFANLDRFPNVRQWIGKILEIDPLIATATAVTTHALYRGLLWSLVILIPTLFLGRFFCNWICPLGSLNQCVGWTFRRFRPSEDVEANRYRARQRIKYYILVGLLAAAAWGSLQIGLFDPIALVYRSFSTAVFPAAERTVSAAHGGGRIYQGAWFIGFLLFGFLAANLLWPRFFCRVLCPLGAMLGVVSRFTWWRIERDPVACNGCNRCLLHCEGACDPHAELRTSECLVCFNCIEECPENALRFQLFPPRGHEVPGTDVSRRKAIFAAVAGVLFFPFVRTSGRSTRDFSSRLIRPPGACEELGFLERCIKCAQCMRVCPTNVLQPAWFEGGLEGLWTPVMNFRIGFCQVQCTACGQVCPTGAILPLAVDQKLGFGAFAERGPVRLGTAHFDTGRCLPHSKNIPCVVCEEVCPTSPKAIYTVRERRTVRGGRCAVLSATETSVTLASRPEDMSEPTDVPVASDLAPSDGTKCYYLSIVHDDGMAEVHPVGHTGGNVVAIRDRFLRVPRPGSEISVQIELAMPKIDLRYCTGCGICEQKCPVVGDRRAVYVTAEGETRSQQALNRGGDRSVRWQS